MGKLMKIAAGILAAVLIGTGGSVSAHSIQNSPPSAGQLPSFGSFTGVIVEISPYYGDDTKEFMLLENVEGQIVNFVLSGDTYIDADLTPGTEVTGFYNGQLPVILIYPPQYNAVAVWVNSPDENVKVDRFDENLVSSDGMLKLNISADTEILAQSADDVPELEKGSINEALAGRALMVFYTITTRSIPAQTTPSKIVVLHETENPFISGETGEQAGENGIAVVVNGEVAGYLPKIVMSDDGSVMVPLRMVCEALGLSITWDETERVVIVDGQYKIFVDDSSGTASGVASIIVEGRTFVPLSFFRDILELNNAYLFEGQIVVDNFEKME